MLFIQYVLLLLLILRLQVNERNKSTRIHAISLNTIQYTVQCDTSQNSTVSII